jgi:hypothetical protein
VNFLHPGLQRGIAWREFRTQECVDQVQHPQRQRYERTQGHQDYCRHADCSMGFSAGANDTHEICNLPAVAVFWAS